MRLRSSLVLAAFALTPGFVVACSATTNNTFGDSSGGAGGASATESTSGSGGSSDIGVFAGSGGNLAGGGGSNSGGGCSAAAELVYVLSEENDLYSFEPDKKVFTKIGALKCQTSLTPNSMAIDRNAVAWVNYVADDDSEGAIFKVSTADASCTKTNIKLGQGWTRLGMGFSTDASGGDTETLFVTGTTLDGNSPGLGKIDFTTNKVVSVGNFSGSLKGQSAELTGTGDAKLYGFFTTTPVVVTEITKTSGATPSPKKLNSVETPEAWAFSFWGGAFYLYTFDEFSDDSSRVNKYDPTTGTVDTSYMEDVGFTIVGAGVSTCAPLKPPS